MVPLFSGWSVGRMGGSVADFRPIQSGSVADQGGIGHALVADWFGSDLVLFLIWGVSGPASGRLLPNSLSISAGEHKSSGSSRGKLLSFQPVAQQSESREVYRACLGPRPGGLWPRLGEFSRRRPSWLLRSDLLRRLHRISPIRHPLAPVLRYISETVFCATHGFEPERPLTRRVPPPKKEDP